MIFDQRIASFDWLFRLLKHCLPLPSVRCPQDLYGERFGGVQYLRFKFQMDPLDLATRK